MTNSDSGVAITGLQVVRKPHRWHFYFKLTGQSSFHSFLLKHPLRLVIDLPGVTRVHGIAPFLYVDTPIIRIRWGHRQQGLRLVLEMQSALRANVKINEHKRQLIITLLGHKLDVLGFPSWPIRHLMHQRKRESVHLHQHAHGHATHQPVLRDVVVVIDPGHGGKDPGAIGIGGTKEKMVVLNIAEAIRRDIDRTPGFAAVLTRHADYYLSLRERLEIARRNKANMFVAIHADKWKNRQAYGASVFALSRRGASSEAARWLAARENASEFVGGVKLGNKSPLLKSVLISLAQSATVRTSLTIGRDILRHLHTVTRLHHDNVEQAAFVVLKSPDIPSLLVETGFLSNVRDEHRLKNPYFRARLASAIARGIVHYFEARPPAGTWLAARMRKQHTHYFAKRGR